MPNTYTLIASNILASATSSVTFSSIPATYTDLVVRASLRSTNSGATYSQLRIVFNNTGAVYSTTTLAAYGGTIEANRVTGDSAANEQVRGSIVGGGNAANTFGITQIYIPNYRSSVNKPFSGIGFAEDSSASNNAIQNQAYLYRDTNAISTMTLSVSATNFAIGSSFYLYGIKNS